MKYARDTRGPAAALAALLIGGNAMAAPIVVLNDGEHRDLIISRGEYLISALSDTLSIIPASAPAGSLPNSIFISFGYTTGGVLAGGLGGNWLPLFPLHPLQTPAILATGGLNLEGTSIDGTDMFVLPTFDPFFGDVSPAFITHGTGPFSGFNLTMFNETNNTAYIGYGSSDLSLFGYMQIERVTEVDWKLIGYSYEPTGVAIDVVKLVVPATGSLLVLGAAGLLVGQMRRR
ncbi:MAG: hypothetical protein KIT19_10250 [Phycisphaeraceae bacterium]|nr:hypothetical protein [Phycisphaeraceae bacterium]